MSFQVYLESILKLLGQCHNVADNEKIECGAPGVTIDECLSDKRCCFDDSTATVPHCYFKKRNLILYVLYYFNVNQ